MRKLILQIQMSIDGFVARPDGMGDWMFYGGRDESLFQWIIEMAEHCDTILMGRNKAQNFIKHWEGVLDSQQISVEQPLAKQIVNMRKIVFSHTLKTIKGRNAEVENGDLATVVKALKAAPGKDILVYGGAKFVSSLIEHDLIDEYYILRNPVAIGQGLSIFKADKRLKLESVTAYSSGKVLNKYLPL